MSESVLGPVAGLGNVHPNAPFDACADCEESPKLVLADVLTGPAPTDNDLYRTSQGT